MVQVRSKITAPNLQRILLTSNIYVLITVLKHHLIVIMNGIRAWHWLVVAQRHAERSVHTWQRGSTAHISTTLALPDMHQHTNADSSSTPSCITSSLHALITHVHARIHKGVQPVDKLHTLHTNALNAYSR